MIISSSGLVGKYELVSLERANNTIRDVQMFIIRGTMERMCEFYEALKDSMQNAVNDDIRKHGYTNSEDVNIGYENDDLMDWRTDPREIAAYERAMRDAKKESLMRFLAEEMRFTYQGDTTSWVAALESAILATEIVVESEPLPV